MLRTTSITSLIRDRKSHQIATAIQTGRKRGMQLFDAHVQQLVEEGLIPVTEAIRCANEPAKFYPLAGEKQPAGLGA
jgi:twitching motility protein PilT